MTDTLARWPTPSDIKEPDREELVDAYNAARQRFIAATDWARLLACGACQSGCHRASLEAVFRADGGLRGARDALEECDNAGLGEHRAVYG